MADTKEPRVFMQEKAGVLSCAGIAPRNDQYGAENIRRKYCMPHQITARHRMSLTIHSWCVGSWLKGNLASAQPAKTLKDSRQKRVWSPRCDPRLHVKLVPSLTAPMTSTCASKALAGSCWTEGTVSTCTKQVHTTITLHIHACRYTYANQTRYSTHYLMLTEPGDS